MSLRDDVRPTISVTLTGEVEEFNYALPDVTGSLVKAGPGDAASQVVVTSLERVRITSVSLGFPMMGEVDVGDDTVGIATVFGLESPARWNGIDLEPGQTFVYAPGSLHQALDSAGMAIGLITADVEMFRAVADALGCDVGWLGASAVDVRTSKSLVGAFRLAQLAARDPLRSDERVLEPIVRALTEPEPPERTTRRVDSSQWITQAVLDHLDETGGWLPSQVDLCRAVGVSPRRLQLAFEDVYDSSPGVFLRHRALTAARNRLLASGPSDDRISAIAHDHGFMHLGRFAQYYRTLFGELPSETLVGHP